MSKINENNLIRFTKITKSKEGLFANFKVKGIRGGTTFTALIAVPLDEAEVDPGDPLEKIIEECARIAEKDIKRSELKFEGLNAI